MTAVAPADNACAIWNATFAGLAADAVITTA